MILVSGFVIVYVSSLASEVYCSDGHLCTMYHVLALVFSILIYTVLSVFHHPCSMMLFRRQSLVPPLSLLNLCSFILYSETHIFLVGSGEIQKTKSHYEEKNH